MAVVLGFVFAGSPDKLANGTHIAVLTVQSHDPVISNQATSLLTSIRGLTAPSGAAVLVTGQTAALWHALRVAGVDARVSGYGRLLAG